MQGSRAKLNTGPNVGYQKLNYGKRTVYKGVCDTCTPAWLGKGKTSKVEAISDAVFHAISAHDWSPEGEATSRPPAPGDAGDSNGDDNTIKPGDSDDPERIQASPCPSPLSGASADGPTEGTAPGTGSATTADHHNYHHNDDGSANHDNHATATTHYGSTATAAATCNTSGVVQWKP